MYVKEGVTTSECEASRILNFKIVSVGDYYTLNKGRAAFSSLLKLAARQPLKADQEVTGQRWCSEVCRQNL